MPSDQYFYSRVLLKFADLTCYSSQVICSEANNYVKGYLHCHPPKNIWGETWVGTLQNQNGLYLSRKVRSRSQKSFPALITVCTWNLPRKGSFQAFFDLDLNLSPAPKLGETIDSFFNSFSSLCLDNPYSFLSLKWNRPHPGGLSTWSSLSQVPFSVLPLNHLVHDTAMALPSHCYAVHFLSDTPTMSVSLSSISQGTQKYLLNEHKYWLCF